MSLSSFRVHQDATGQQSSASTEKVTNTHRRAAAVGCRCHRSACKKTRPDSRVLPRRKKGDEHPPPRGCGRMSMSSFRVHQDLTGQNSASTKKRDEHPPPSGCGRMSLSSFRVNQDTTGQQSSASTEKVTNTHPRPAAVGCRCHRSACTKTRPDSRVVPRRKKVTNTHRRVAATRPDSRVVPRRKKVTNTHRRAAAVGCRCHRSACTKTRPDSRVVPRRKKVTNTHRRADCGRMSLSSFRVHQDATGQQSSASTEKSDEHPPPSGCGRMSLSSFRVHQDATGQQSSASTEKK
ncbi:hypothetical protein TNCV_2439831 [Trichonephila clavipes]|nr:hypothetical protein TNCV_2439831 [Trichonephila clavipes]